jgi:TolB-like protein/Flp pilus assembly protein TadD
LFLQGQHADAITQAREAVRLSNNQHLFAARLAFMGAQAGQPDEARMILDDLITRSAKAYVPPAQIALVHAGLDEKDRMFEWFEKAYQERDSWLLNVVTDPFLAPVRGDPRFVDLVRRVGLPPLPVWRGSEPPSSPLDEEGNREVARGRIMLAVLPFENLSRDPEQDYFSDGLTEEMITQLGRLNPQKLGVIARSSAMRYKNADRAIDRVRRELGVDYVVEGSVRRAENRVRITAKLIQCSDQSQLWANSFERELKHILVLQSDIAQAIAQEIKVTLTPQEQARMAKAGQVNPEAHEAYLKGRFHWNKRTPDGLRKAVDNFEQVVALAPDWPLGYAGLADAYVVMSNYAFMRPSEAIPKARTAAANALKMDESLAEAHATLAGIATDYDWDWRAAEREYQRALMLSPNYATAHHWYATYLSFTGHHDEAIREITTAQELDPISLAISSAVGWVYYLAGDFTEAETRLRKALEFDPDFAVAHEDLAMTLFLQERFAEAIIEAREAIRLSNNKPSALLGYMCAKAGQPEEARSILDGLAARSTEAYVAPTDLALVHAGLDERDRMFEWLEKAYQERDVTLPYMLTDPLLADMRPDPRFVDLVRRVGLPDLDTSNVPTNSPSIEPSP